jgi:hypothetical protein
MNSDQHAEAFEDHELQEQLLAGFLTNGEITKAHLTLVLLSIQGIDTQRRGWNRVLQHYVLNRQYRAMLDTLQNMQSQGNALTLRTMNLMYSHLLPPRRPGRRYAKRIATDIFDPLVVCTSAFIHSAERKAYVPHHIWAELLKRYGMDDRWDDLRRLALWMAHWYTQEENGVRWRSYVQWSNRRRRLLGRHEWARQIFTPNMVKAFFTWGFRHASRQHKLHLVETATDNQEHQQITEPWAVGLGLLSILHGKGFATDLLDVRNAFTQRMWVLFGPAFSVERLNNEARLSNKLTLRHYIRHANEVWPGLVDWVEPRLLEDSSTEDVLMLVQFFGAFSATNSVKGEYADVKAWAEILAQSGNDCIYEPYRISNQEIVWRNSKFRRLLVQPQKTEGSTQNATNYHPLLEHRSPSAHSESSHPPPSLQYTPEHP